MRKISAIFTLFCSFAYGESQLIVYPKFELGIDAGIGAYTGGMGKTSEKGLLLGAKFTARVLPSLGVELAYHRVQQNETIVASATQQLTLQNKIQPFTLGAVYSIVGPLYVVGGVGHYRRNMEVVSATGGLTATVSSASTGSWGFFGGLGLQFDLPAFPLSFGVDMRYHAISFPDENDDFGIPGVSRSTDYVTSHAFIAYRFGV